MCTFQQLYFDDNGYVVRCKECGHYQVGYACVALTLAQEDFNAFREIINHKIAETKQQVLGEKTKCIYLPTPSAGVQLLLTVKEALHLFEILEYADSEAKSLSLISLFA